ncbi:hypothetical protein ILUMI_26068 [Ignelater luminosus]|uniref:Chorein N-terminal domain-containing protein n=1 Tax=Ignelater luminosus TaxID=2038154 RepID=A0A8K0FZ17_IGNLU|nr:hypothetical protein ILUMI_26068 [Ignelater luminosus]
MGRRWPLAVTIILAGVACLLALPIPYILPNSKWLVTAFAMIGKLSISSSNAVIPVFTAELYPTTIRNIGVGASNVTAGIALLLVPYLWTMAEMHGSVPMAVLGVCGIIGGLSVLFLPETGNAPLEVVKVLSENIGGRHALRDNPVYQPLKIKCRRSEPHCFCAEFKSIERHMILPPSSNTAAKFCRTLLNQLLGKYVVDLDTENLNVGIFSGHVQLTDLQLKSEALYELNLPIKVKIGTIGKIWLKIPWNYLWNEPVVINIEDIHIIAEPIVTFEKYDPEKDKRLLRALKRKILSELDTEKEYIGGPNYFSEHLLTNIVNNLQLNVTNVHIRYEDSVSADYPLACGLCIGNITAETTNRRTWRESTPNVSISDKIVAAQSHSDFLRNDKNKDELLKQLMKSLSSTVVIDRALQLESENNIVFVVANNINILVTFVARGKAPSTIEVLHPPSGKISANVFSVSGILDDIRHSILFCHTMTDRGKASAVFGKRKKLVFNTMKFSFLNAASKRSMLPAFISGLPSSTAMVEDSIEPTS